MFKAEITKCRTEIFNVEWEMLKTRWRMWNSTCKTGVKGGFLNFVHRIFNMLKKERLVYSLYTEGLWKTFSAVKRTDNRRQTGNTKDRRRKPQILSENRKKNAFFYGNECRLMLYFKMI